jgi:NADH:ubiquinone reductase (H+-translocating)
MDKHKHHVVVVGGGFAGVKTALELGHNPDVRVTLIAPTTRFEYHAAIYRSVSGMSPLEVVVPFSEIFADDPDIEIVNDFMTELVAASKDIREIKLLSGRSISYDSLVLALGYEVEYFGIPGMRENALNMYNVSDAIILRNTIVKNLQNPTGKRTDIVVIGAGPTGIELAANIPHFCEMVDNKYDLNVCNISVTLLDQCERVLPMLLPEVSYIAETELKKAGVKIRIGSGVKQCTPSTITLNDGTILNYDVLIWTAGSKSNPFFAKYPEIFTLGKKGRVVVDNHMQPNSPDIYIVGDCADTQYSGMAQTAIEDAKFIAVDIVSRIAVTDRAVYAPKEPAYIVPLGESSAVMQNDGVISTGDSGWLARREADRWVMQNFLPEHLADKHWKKAEQQGKF